MFETQISAGATENYQGGKSLTQRRLRGPTIWKDMLKNALKDIANWQAKRRTEQLYKVSSPCLDEHRFKKEDLESVGELSKVCSQDALKMIVFGQNW